MSYHTHTSLLFHYVFTTKNRIPSIPQELQVRLWAYMGGIARANKMKALAVGRCCRSFSRPSLASADNHHSQSDPVVEGGLVAMDAGANRQPPFRMAGRPWRV